jgi:ATP-dependent exoDNAse (exonuclease V) alpha subunit
MDAVFNGLINDLKRKTNVPNNGNNSDNANNANNLDNLQTDDTQNYDRFIAHVHLMMKSDLLNSLQYTFFTEFAKIDGSLINIRFFIDVTELIEENIRSEFSEDVMKLLNLNNKKINKIIKLLKKYKTRKEIKDSKNEIISILINHQSSEKNIIEKDTIPLLKPLLKIMDIRLNKNNLMNKFKIISSELFNKFLKYNSGKGNFRINKNIRYNMTKVDTIEFTKQQKQGLWKIYDFLINPNATTFCFQGYAGTGKTTTIVELVSYLIKNRYIQSIAFTAPTNKAVNVIKNKFRPHLRSIVETMFDKKLEPNFCFDDSIAFLELNLIKISFITIHKLLMFKTDYSVTGDMIFVRDQKSDSLISDYELVLADECSMINMDMVDNIFQEIRSCKNTRSKGFKRVAKLMFTGDPAQLPPVNEENSSIFSKSKEELTFGDYTAIMNFKLGDLVISDTISFLKNKYNQLIDDLEKMDSFLLTDVVRSRLDNVTHVCNEFRHLVADKSYDINKLSTSLTKLFKQRSKYCYTGFDKNKLGTSLNKLLKEKVNSDSDYKSNYNSDSNDPTILEMHGVRLYQYQEELSKLKSQWFKHFLKTIEHGNMAIILTWTNRQTEIYNATIRRKIFKNKKNIKKFEEGDILMLSDFYSLDLGEEFVNQTLYTSEQIKVVKTETQEVTLKSFEMIKTKTYQKMKIYNKIQPEMEMLINYMNDEFCKNKKFISWLLKVHRCGEDANKCMPIMVIDDKNLVDFKQCKKTTNDMIRNFASKLLNKHKNNQRQIEKTVIKPLWIQWRKIYDEPFANVNYGYSITTHKAQGSGFQDAYVDLNDILQNPKDIEAYKCSYTAVTRASNELHILI